MASPQTIFEIDTDAQSVRIFNSPPVIYDLTWWNQVKADKGWTDQELADVLNNFKP